MAEANAHYYATRDPLGAAGDFITAPEISQMFGELVGRLAGRSLAARRAARRRALCRARARAAARWPRMRCGRCAAPGSRRRVAARRDQPGAARRAGRAGRRRAGTTTLRRLPDDGPLLIVANEFFDALPVRQFDADGARAAIVVADGDGSCAAARSRPKPRRRRSTIVARLARRLARAGRRGADRRLRP